MARSFVEGLGYRLREGVVPELMGRVFSCGADSWLTRFGLDVDRLEEKLFCAELLDEELDLGRFSLTAFNLSLRPLSFR